MTTNWSLADCKQCVWPRSGDCNKGDFGYIALVGGSLRYSGAAKLANLAAAAMRSGAGVVKLAVPQEIAIAVAPYLLESTLFPLASQNGELLFEQAQTDELTRNVDAMAIGMGCGAGEGVRLTLRYLLRCFGGTLVVDADGINCLAQDVALLDAHTPTVILTPHVKEFSRLLAVDIPYVRENGARLAKQFAAEHGVILLLKGATTIVTDGKSTIAVRRGCAGMATAGSGDVLSGILTALCGYNADKPLQAAATATYINGLAGELAEKYCNSVSMTAGDTVRHISSATSEILRCR